MCGERQKVSWAQIPRYWDYSLLQFSFSEQVLGEKVIFCSMEIARNELSEVWALTNPWYWARYPKEQVTGWSLCVQETRIGLWFVKCDCVDRKPVEKGEGFVAYSTADGLRTEVWGQSDRWSSWRTVRKMVVEWPAGQYYRMGWVQGWDRSTGIS